MSYPYVDLTPEEMAHGEEVGRMNVEAMAGVPDSHGLVASYEHNLMIRVMGALGEKAVAVIFEADEWGFRRNPYDVEGDVRRMFVRTQKPKAPNVLTIRPNIVTKHHHIPYLLVQDVRPRFFFLGWMWPSLAATMDEYKGDNGNGRPEAWFIPAKKLFHIDALAPYFYNEPSKDDALAARLAQRKANR
jgi:hypothetical protein